MSSVLLHFVVGPTSIGKTSRAIDLAAQTGAPVIVLDRIQCFSELATGSGRPALSELRSTRRIYIAERKVAEGELPALVANSLLLEHVNHLARSEPLLILEGGSVSLLRAITSDPRWNCYDQIWEQLRLRGIEKYLAKAKVRVREMLRPMNGLMSMLEELANLWPDVHSREVVRNVVGYRGLIAFAERNRIPVCDMPHSLLPEQIDELAGQIALQYLDYAQWQDRELLNMPLQIQRAKTDAFCLETA